MAAEVRQGNPSAQQPGVGPKTELYRYSASSYTTKSNEGISICYCKLRDTAVLPTVIILLTRNPKIFEGNPQILTNLLALWE